MNKNERPPNRVVVNTKNKKLEFVGVRRDDNKIVCRKCGSTNWKQIGGVKGFFGSNSLLMCECGNTISKHYINKQIYKEWKKQACI